MHTRAHLHLWWPDSSSQQPGHPKPKHSNFTTTTSVSVSQSFFVFVFLSLSVSRWSAVFPWRQQQEQQQGDQGQRSKRRRAGWASNCHLTENVLYKNGQVEYRWEEKTEGQPWPTCGGETRCGGTGRRAAGGGGGGEDESFVAGLRPLDVSPVSSPEKV